MADTMTRLDRIREAIAGSLPQFRKRVALGQAYARTFDSPDGRRVLIDILRNAGVLEAAHEPGSPVEDSIWRDGRKALGLDILQTLRWSEGELLELARERTAEELDDAREGASLREVA